MSPKEINTALCSKIEQSLQYLFKGAGKFATGRFSIGNIDGEEGDSLYVYLKDGRFQDSATGEHGDILELFKLKFGSKEGIDIACSFLGIQRRPMEKKKKLVDWKRPERDWTQLTENPAVLEYLTKERKIPENILKKYNVRAKDDDRITFICYAHEQSPEGKPMMCGASYIHLKRKLKDGKLKKVVYQSTNPLATLWGHPVVEKRKNANGRTFLIITEGQIDAMSVAACGFQNVVSIPYGTGADQWIENSWDFIVSFDEVYFFFDNDSAGQKLTESSAKRIGFERCRKCILPAHFNDANEAFVDGYDLNLCVENATEFKPSKLVEASEIYDDTLVRLSHGRREDQGIPFLGWDSEEDTINFRVRPKEMTLYTGWPGDGKSNALYQETAYLVCTQGKKVVIASLEEDAEDILGIMAFHALATPYDPSKPAVIKAFKALKEVFRNKIYFYYHRNRAPFSEVLQTLEFTIRKHDAEHAIMDSVAKTDLNIEDNKDANEFVSKLTDSMNQTGAHYHVVAHARKGEGKGNRWAMPGLNDVKGSNQFGIETFNCLSFWRCPKKVEMMQEIREKGFYTKREWQESPDTKTGGFLSKGTRGFKDVDMSEEEVLKHPDSWLEVCKQKVGGQKGRYGTFFHRETYRLSRQHEQPKPFAIDIYNEYILKDQEGDF